MKHLAEKKAKIAKKIGSGWGWASRMKEGQQRVTQNMREKYGTEYLPESAHYKQPKVTDAQKAKYKKNFEAEGRLHDYERIYGK